MVGSASQRRAVILDHPRMTYAEGPTPVMLQLLTESCGELVHLRTATCQSLLAFLLASSVILRGLATHYRAIQRAIFLRNLPLQFFVF